MKFTASSATDIGRKRAKNEDYHCSHLPADEATLKNKGALFVVADGMGGHQAGEVASKLACESVVRFYYASTKSDPHAALRDAFVEANRLIGEEALKKPDHFGMGTTCTALALLEGKAFLAHVGDSRAYLYRAESLGLLTQDHTLVGELVRFGVLSAEEARLHPSRNVITRSLGARLSVEVDLPAPLETRKGDIFLLCTDGLTAMMRDEELEEVLAERGVECAERLIDMANGRGGKDNITVQVVRIDEV